MDDLRKSSRLSGFYQKTVAERVAILADWANLDAAEVDVLAESLGVTQADKMTENVVGRYALPLGIGANFLVNGVDHLIPMVIEEPSVVAAVSNAARLARSGGGFFTGSTEPIMIGQIQLLDVPDLHAAQANLLAAKDRLLLAANTSPTIARLGGGPRDLSLHPLETSAGPMLIVHLHFDCRDAMGANAVNTAAETIAPLLEELSGGRALLRILSNLTDERRAWAETAIPLDVFAVDGQSGAEVAQGIVEANAFAVADPYRAATHNKGIFNGIDAVLLATGNDWRAVAAGGHAYAARHGRYQALTDWRIILNAASWSGTRHDQPPPWLPASARYPLLYGHLEMPLSVGTVGGATRSHPSAQIAMKILNLQGARHLAEVIVAVGLAQNLAAVRALVTDGIQRGHMRLHARQIAVSAGARDDQVDVVAARLVQENAIRLERAQQLLTEMAKS